MLYSHRVRYASLTFVVALCICLAGCAGAEPSPKSAASPPVAHRPANSAVQVDVSSDVAFTNSVRQMLLQRDPARGWSSREPLELTGGQLVVNLGRLWTLCRNAPAQCDAEVTHFLSEVVAVANRQRSAPATAQQLVAVVRPASYLDAMGNAAQRTLSQAFTANLVIIYMVDQGGSVRGATAEDLSSSGVRREALAATAAQNLAAVLPVLPQQRECAPHSVSVWATGNYYESSRLLLTEYWNDVSEGARRSIVVAAPAADALIVACDLNREELGRLAQAAGKISQTTDRPVSQSLLQWTANGWKELRP